VKTEIERKFLVLNDDWRPTVSRILSLRDGLIAASDGRKVRVRICGEAATLTVKGERIGFSRPEFEYEIPLQEVEFLMQICAATRIEKERSYVPYRGATWQVDRYTFPFEIVIAEIELPREDASFELPPWIGEEVTGQMAYRKATLLSTWRIENRK
jgi:adenylate cyclase